MITSALVVSDEVDDIRAGLLALHTLGLAGRWIKVVASSDPDYARLRGGPLVGIASEPDFGPLEAECPAESAGVQFSGFICNCDQAVDLVGVAPEDALVADLRWFTSAPAEVDISASRTALEVIAAETTQAGAVVNRLLRGEIRDLADEEYYPGLLAVLRFANQLGRVVVLVSNRGAIARVQFLEPAGVSRDRIASTRTNAATDPDAGGELLGFLRRWSGRIRLPSELRTALLALESPGVTLHDLLNGEGSDDVRSQVTLLQQEFLGVDAQWTSLFSSKYAREAFKSLLGSKKVLTGTGAWLAALAAYNRLNLPESCTTRGLTLDSFTKAAAQLQGLMLTAKRGLDEHIALVDAFSFMCEKLFKWDDKHAPEDKKGRAALEAVVVDDPVGSLCFRFEFPLGKSGAGLAASVWKYFTDRQTADENGAGRSIWSFISPSLVSGQAFGSAQVPTLGSVSPPALYGAGERTYLRWETRRTARASSLRSTSAGTRSAPAVTVLVLDTADERRDALVSAFSGFSAVYSCDPDEPAILWHFNRATSENEIARRPPKRVTLTLRHLRDNRKPSPVAESARTVYYGGRGLGDPSFVGSAADPSHLQETPVPPAEWPEGPPGFMIQQRVDPDGRTGVPTVEEVKQLLEWAEQSAAGRPVDLPTILRPPERDGVELLLALSLLCQGCLAVLSRTDSRAEVKDALSEMGWTQEFENSALGAQICAGIDARTANERDVLGADWWLTGLGATLPNLDANQLGLPGFEVVQSLLDSVGRGERLKPSEVTAAFLALWRHLEGS